MSGHEDALIVRYVEENPRRPGPADARLKDWGIELWALLSYLDRAVAGNVAQAAADYEIPVEAVEAARAYYRLHRQPLDARIAISAA